MLYTLKHVFVLTFLTFISLAIPIGIAAYFDLKDVNTRALFMLPFSFLLFIFLIWPIHRILSLRPLVLPTCPHCNTMQGNYHIPKEVWPIAILICHQCNQPIRLWLTDNARYQKIDDIETLCLKKPKFLGLWLNAKKLTLEAEIKNK